MSVARHTDNTTSGEHNILCVERKVPTRPDATPCDLCGTMLVPAGTSPGKWEWDCPNEECGVSRWDLIQ